MISIFIRNNNSNDENTKGQNGAATNKEYVFYFKIISGICCPVNLLKSLLIYLIPGYTTNVITTISIENIKKELDNFYITWLLLCRM